MLSRYEYTFSEDYLRSLSQEELIAHIRKLEDSREQERDRKLKEELRENELRNEMRNYLYAAIGSVLALVFFICAVIAEADIHELFGSGPFINILYVAGYSIGGYVFLLLLNGFINFKLKNKSYWMSSDLYEFDYSKWAKRKRNIYLKFFIPFSIIAVVLIIFAQKEIK